ncbi:hypothetical protein ACP70R_019340 [Stipagrostis hirtigluma subsp. patula]
MPPGRAPSPTVAPPPPPPYWGSCATPPSVEALSLARIARSRGAASPEASANPNPRRRLLVWRRGDESDVQLAILRRVLQGGTERSGPNAGHRSQPQTPVRCPKEKGTKGDCMMRGLLHRQDEEEPVAKRQHKPEAIFIPDDVLEQILLRLPVKSLLRFKSVCKSWRDTIAGPRFERCQLQLSRARRPSILVLPLLEMPRPLRMDRIMFFAYPGHGTAAELMHEKLWSSGIDSFLDPLHCDGLVVVTAAHSSQIFVCNPATKELMVLPAGAPDSGSCQRVGFGVDPSTGKYKAVRCFERYCDEGMTNYSIGCEIFTLGSREWKPAVDPPYMIKPMTPVCLPGAVYWSAGASLSKQVMLRFDLHDEEFTVFPTPPCMELADLCSNLTDLAGKLCYNHALGHTVQLWMADDDGIRLPKWFLYRTIVLPWFTKSIAAFSAYEGGIYLHVDLAHIYRYTTEGEALERVVDMKEEMAYFCSQGTLYPYRPTGSKWVYCVVQYSETDIN